jgi:hypothetical protein
MKMRLVLVPMVVAALIALTQCFNQSKAPVQKATATVSPQLITHKEAVDTLLADSTAPIKPLIFKALTESEMMAHFNKMTFDSLFVWEDRFPDNGFYGDDRYRIEVMFTEFKKDEKDPTLYRVKGKNRFKKTISTFEGTVKMTTIRQFRDPNIDTAEVGAMGVAKMYAAEGMFELSEDKALTTSGVFKGKLQFEFSQDSAGYKSLWFYSNGLPSGGAGYRFDGTWTSYAKADMVKPIIWASDIFRFANDILKDFSYGEREVEINPKYRDLGWDNFWENEEWWKEPAKPKM